MIEEHAAGTVNFKWQDIPHCRGFNQLPFRMLVPQAITNLLVAGRCGSMTHMGQSAARVSGACFVMGQAAGTAVALAADENTLPKSIDVKRLQNLLTENGVYLGDGT
jgi:FAD dependent oxidoreductase